MKTFSYLLTSLFALLVISAAAQIPETISFQGILKDNNGDVVTDGSYAMEFQLFDAISSGTSVWGPELHNSVSTTDGLYSVILGSITPFTTAVAFDGGYFLQIKVGAEVLTPRIALNGSPYAFTARSIVGSDNIVPATGNVGIGTTTPTTELEVVGTVTATEFVGGGAGLTGLPSSPWTGTSNISYSGGNVGIGTNTPTSTLDVSGTITVKDIVGEDPASSKISGFMYEGDGSGLTGLPSSPWTGTPDISYNNGKVGVGTATPIHKLHVIGTKPGSITTSVENLDPTGYSSFELQNDLARSYRLNLDGSSLTYPNSFYLWDSDILGPRLLVDPTGNVGIGTTTPATKLDVNGTVTATSFTGDGSGLTGLASSPWVGTFDISYSNGQVGIGTTTPQAPLEVVGGIIADGFSGPGTGLTDLDADNFTLGSLDIIYGGTGSTSATGARTNLGLAIGTNVQAYDADLSTYAGITPSADVQDMLGSATEANIRINIGVEIGTDVQAFDLDLADLADGSLTGSKVGSGISATNLTTGTMPDGRLEPTVDVMRLNTSGGLHVGSSSDPGTDNLIVDGFTKLGGTSAPAIKYLKITGTTGTSEGSDISVNTGLTGSKILAVSVLVDYSSSSYIPPNFTNNAEFEYQVYFAGGILHVWNTPGNSGNILSRPFTALITYEQ